MQPTRHNNVKAATDLLTDKHLLPSIQYLPTLLPTVAFVLIMNRRNKNYTTRVVNPKCRPICHVSSLSDEHEPLQRMKADRETVSETMQNLEMSPAQSVSIGATSKKKPAARIRLLVKTRGLHSTSWSP